MQVNISFVLGGRQTLRIAIHPESPSATQPINSVDMEEGARTKKTIFVGGVADDVDEATIYECFSTFGTLFDLLYMNLIVTDRVIGDIVEVQLPPQNTNPNQPPGRSNLIVSLSLGGATIFNFRWQTPWLCIRDLRVFRRRPGCDR